MEFDGHCVEERGRGLLLRTGSHGKGQREYGDNRAETGPVGRPPYECNRKFSHRLKNPVKTSSKGIVSE
jgi:hypothetical protein